MRTAGRGRLITTRLLAVHTAAEMAMLSLVFSVDLVETLRA